MKEKAEKNIIAFFISIEFIAIAPAIGLFVFVFDYDSSFFRTNKWLECVYCLWPVFMSYEVAV